MNSHETDPVDGSLSAAEKGSDSNETSVTPTTMENQESVLPSNEGFSGVNTDSSLDEAQRSAAEQEMSDVGETAFNELPKLSGVRELKCALEALLFATTEPLSVARLAKVLGAESQSEVRAALLELIHDYETNPRGLQIVEVAGGFQMASRPLYAPFIFRLKPSRRRNPLSQATLETLAIIAYKQPVTRAEIDAIRGVDSSASVHTLLELGLIEVGGKREVPGRPQLYVTTQHFLKTFGLRSLGDLPSIQELKRMFSNPQEKASPDETSAPGNLKTTHVSPPTAFFSADNQKSINSHLNIIGSDELKTTDCAQAERQPQQDVRKDENPQ